MAPSAEIRPAFCAVVRSTYETKPPVGSAAVKKENWSKKEVEVP
jgi:hypothetical protein